MKKLLMTTTAVAIFALGITAAVTQPSALEQQQGLSSKQARDAVLAMAPDVWAKFALASIDMSWFIGKNWVGVVNSTDEDIVSIVCDGNNDWQFIGAKHWHKFESAPEKIPARRVGIIQTDGFDGYCKGVDGLIATGSEGGVYNVVLSLPGNFTGSVAAYVSPNGRRN